MTGNVAGSGALFKTGNGTLTLLAGDTHTGDTTVSQGRLIKPTPHGFYTTNAALEFRTTDSLQFNGFIDGTGSLIKSGAGGLILFSSQGYGGATTVNEGSLLGFGSTLPTSTALAIGSGAEYFLAASSTQTVASLAGPGTLAVGSSAVFTVNETTTGSFSGTVTGDGSFTKTGAGTLTLTGANTHTGGTTVNGGALSVAQTNGTYVVNSGGTLDIKTATDGTLSGTVVGVGLLTKSGAGTLTVATRPTVSKLTLTEGTLKGTTTVLNRDVASTGGTLQFDQVTNCIYNREFTGAGSLLKTGAGTVNMAFPLAHTGGVRISGGSLTTYGGSAGGLTVDAAGRLSNESGTLAFQGPVANAGEIMTLMGATTSFLRPVSGAGNFPGAGTVSFESGGGYSPGKFARLGDVRRKYDPGREQYVDDGDRRNHAGHRL